MIQFTDDELRRIQQSVEFAYDVNETLMIAKKIAAYLESKKTGEKESNTHCQTNKDDASI